MNIILKSFDGPLHKITAEEAFAGSALGTCYQILNQEEDLASLKAQHTHWIPATPMRAGDYNGTNWSDITALDEELIWNMYHCEARFLNMVERYAQGKPLPYQERKRQYLHHLRYWNHILETGSIDLCLFNHAPHQAYDLVLYELCQYKKVPAYHLERCYSVEGVLLASDFEASSPELLRTYERLLEEYADPEKPVELSESYEAFYKRETSKEDSGPWFAVDRDAHLQQTSFVSKWSGKSLDLLRRKPGEFFKNVLSPSVWRRKLSQHKDMMWYDQHVSEPDLSVPYIYVPLQAQPEEGVSPRCGAFEHQQLTVQLLADCVPQDTKIYVKEHPNQGELYRSEEWYRSMESIPCVEFVPRSFDTFTLMRHAKAVATGTGTAGFEALFRGVPFLMFGHRWCQYADGVFRIRTRDDCLHAMKAIFEEGFVPDVRKLRIYLKAIELSSVPFEGGPNTPGKPTPQERARQMGIMIRERLAAYL